MIHYLLVFFGRRTWCRATPHRQHRLREMHGRGVCLWHLRHQHIGSTVMGLIAGYLAFQGEAWQHWRLFLMTGILGGYTAFSALSLDAGLLNERGTLGLAALYMLGSVGFSIAGLFAGLALIRYLT